MSEEQSTEPFVTITRMSRFRWETSVHPHAGEHSWIGYVGPRFWTRKRAERWANRWVDQQKRLRIWREEATRIGGE